MDPRHWMRWRCPSVRADLSESPIWESLSIRGCRLKLDHPCRHHEPCHLVLLSTPCMFFFFLLSTFLFYSYYCLEKHVVQGGGEEQNYSQIPKCDMRPTAEQIRDPSSSRQELPRCSIILGEKWASNVSPMSHRSRQGTAPKRGF